MRRGEVGTEKEVDKSGSLVSTLFNSSKHIPSKNCDSSKNANQRTECFSRSSLLREADMIFRRMEEGASKWAFRHLRLLWEMSNGTEGSKFDVSFAPAR